MVEDSIWIVTNETDLEPVEGERGWGENLRKKLSSTVEVKLPISELEQKMGGFLQLVGRLFKQANQQVELTSGMCLDEVQLLVEISAKGEVKLVAGGEAASKGAITLKFKRVDS
jgi:hypothetical protein